MQAVSQQASATQAGETVPNDAGLTVEARAQDMVEVTPELVKLVKAKMVADRAAELKKAGYTILDGTVNLKPPFRVGVQQDWVKGETSYEYPCRFNIACSGNLYIDLYASDVVFLGEVKTEAREVSVCGEMTRSARVYTDHPIAYKPITHKQYEDAEAANHAHRMKLNEKQRAEEDKKRAERDRVIKFKTEQALIEERARIIAHTRAEVEAESVEKINALAAKSVRASIDRLRDNLLKLAQADVGGTSADAIESSAAEKKSA